MSSSYKLVLLGDGRVGKTSLVSRFAENKFNAGEESTVKAQMYKRARLVVDGRPVDVSVWDTAGQERFHALGPLYYRGADGAVLVYDITDTDSFTRVRQWVKELKRTVGDEICLVLCGNKCDLEREKLVPESDAVNLAKRYNATHFYTSAKNDVNVQEAFQDLITRAVRRRTRGGAGGGADADDIFGGSPTGRSPTQASGADELYGGGGSASRSAGKGGKKKRGLLIDESDAGVGAAGGGAYGGGTDDGAAGGAGAGSSWVDADGFGGEPANSFGSPPRDAAPPPAQPTRGGDGAPKSMRVTLGPSAEGNAAGARPPRDAADRKKKKSGPGCCGK